MKFSSEAKKSNTFHMKNLRLAEKIRFLLRERIFKSVRFNCNLVAFVPFFPRFPSEIRLSQKLFRLVCKKREDECK